MSNENSNLRVGSAGAGLFVGSTEILGGLNNYINTPSKNRMVVITNVTDKFFNGTIKVNGAIYKQLNLNPNEVYIEGFGDNENVSLCYEGYCDVQAHFCYKLSNGDMDMYYQFDGLSGCMPLLSSDESDSINVSFIYNIEEY